MFLLFTLQVNTKYCRIFIIIHHYIQLPCDCNYGRFSFDQLHYINIFHYLMASKVNEQPATFWYMVLAGKFLFNTNWKKQQRHAINKIYMHFCTYIHMHVFTSIVSLFTIYICMYTKQLIFTRLIRLSYEMFLWHWRLIPVTVQLLLLSLSLWGSILPLPDWYRDHCVCIKKKVLGFSYCTHTYSFFSLPSHELTVF